ncbi:MAG: DUF2914 domain-containing protein [Bdellovibrionota bacterium]
MKETFDSIKSTVHKYRKWEPLVFFIAGFTFDAILLHRIDDPLMLVHQAIYLVLSAFIIAWDLFNEIGLGHVPSWLQKPWKYREGILHFLLGTLLNVYTIFYFKSGTIFGSLVFLMILGALLFLNEVRPPHISKHILRNGLFALCLVSYMNIIVPIAIGSIGVWVFILAIAAATLIHSLYVLWLKKKLETRKVWLEIRLPFVGVAVVYTLLYLFKVLPPVPLSLKYIGIYHQVAKVGDTYQLSYTRPAWKFWQSGDQTFEAKPGDTINCFVQVFSPTRFKDQLFVRWQYYDTKRGWVSADAIPLGIVGGRAEGYRGYTTKNNYQPGEWKVNVETNDGRVVGGIKFQVVAAEASDEPVVMNVDLK